MHSAKWDDSFDWTDKTVALLGSGSSGIQILPSIQPKAKKVVHFVRGKAWISPVGFSPDEPENGKATTSSESVAYYLTNHL